MNRKPKSNALILAAMVALLAGGVAWAGSELRLETLEISLEEYDDARSFLRKVSGTTDTKLVLEHS